MNQAAVTQLSRAERGFRAGSRPLIMRPKGNARCAQSWRGDSAIYLEETGPVVAATRRYPDSFAADEGRLDGRGSFGFQGSFIRSEEEFGGKNVENETRSYGSVKVIFIILQVQNFALVKLRRRNARMNGEGSENRVV